jgi:hypothetical protein
MAAKAGSWPGPRYAEMAKIEGVRYFNRAIFDASFALPEFMIEK